MLLTIPRLFSRRVPSDAQLDLLTDPHLPGTHWAMSSRRQMLLVQHGAAAEDDGHAGVWIHDSRRQPPAVVE
ncbi:MAG TPA: hypothetical protein VGJ04_12430, partial [Pirellulales bacterium]